MVSITTRAVFCDAPRPKTLARAATTYGARMIGPSAPLGLFAAAHSGRDATLAEIASPTHLEGGLHRPLHRRRHCWATRSPGDGELNRRNAVVHVPPTAGMLRTSSTGRACSIDTHRHHACDLGVASAATRALPNIRFIWSHAGGTVPFLSGRIEASRAGGRTSPTASHAIKRFYYDLAADEPRCRGVVLCSCSHRRRCSSH